MFLSSGRRPAGRSARGGVLSCFRRRDSRPELRHALNEVAFPQLSHRLDEARTGRGCCPRRATTGRVRPHPAYQARRRCSSTSRPRRSTKDWSSRHMSSIRRERPDTIVVSVSDRHSVDQHHQHQLQPPGEGPGGWARWGSTGRSSSVCRRHRRKRCKTLDTTT